MRLADGHRVASVVVFGEGVLPEKDTAIERLPMQQLLADQALSTASQLAAMLCHKCVCVNFAGRHLANDGTGKLQSNGKSPGATAGLSSSGTQLPVWAGKWASLSPKLTQPFFPASPECQAKDDSPRRGGRNSRGVSPWKRSRTHEPSPEGAAVVLPAPSHHLCALCLPLPGTVCSDFFAARSIAL